MAKCTAVIGSMTNSFKAQKALAAASIHSMVVKLDSAYTNKGCAYGLEYDCIQNANIRKIFSSYGIKVSRYVEKGGSNDLSR